MLWLPLWGRDPGVTLHFHLFLAANLEQSPTSLSFSHPICKMGMRTTGWQWECLFPSLGVS